MEDVIVDDAVIMACDCELPVPKLSDILLFEVVDPTVADDGDNEGTVDIDDPGDVEFEFTLRWA